MRLAVFETDHPISRNVCGAIARALGCDLRNVSDRSDEYDAVIGYGILRGTKELFARHQHWFEIDKGFWDAGHYQGLYRLSYKGTQPLYTEAAPQKDHGVVFEGSKTGYTLVCPPTGHVREFFGIEEWRYEAPQDSKYIVRPKEPGVSLPIDWENVRRLVTFNSSLGFEALRRGIPVVSDPVHSTIGSFQKNAIDPSNLDELYSFASGHQFKLDDQGGINWLINYYLTKYGSDGIPAKPLQRMFSNTRYDAGPSPD